MSSPRNDSASTHSLLGVITARGGSKGIPKKNVVLCGGIPLLAWTIRAALESQVVSRLVLSTDDEEIAEVGTSYGAEVPFMRPARLAEDWTPSIDVLINVLEHLERTEGYRPEYVLLLQPTSPLRREIDIRLAWEKMLSTDALSVIGVSPAHQHPFWIKRMDAEGRLSSFLPTPVPAVRQELPPAYIVNGAIYLSSRETILANKSFYSDRTYGYVMPVERSVDIDTEFDLQLAELLMQKDLYGAR